MDKLLIAIHGLRSKPPRPRLEAEWRASVAEGLGWQIWPENLPFKMVYWADVMPRRPEELTREFEIYRPSDVPLTAHDDGWADLARSRASKTLSTAVDGLYDYLGDPELPLKILESHAPELARYYGDAAIRREIRGRLRDAILSADEAMQDVMILAHSMGSIIAYDVLRELEQKAWIRIHHFVSLGSPLGLPFIHRRILNEFGDISVPSSVAAWSNFSDRGDRVCIDTHLSDDFSPTHGIAIWDDIVINTYVNQFGQANCHKSFGYLRAPEVAHAIADFLGL